MLLQIGQHTDSLDSLSQTSGQDHTGIFLLFIGGAILLIVVIWVLMRHGARKPTRQPPTQPSDSETRYSDSIDTETKTVSSNKSKWDLKPEEPQKIGDSISESKQPKPEIEKLSDTSPEPLKPKPVEARPEEQSQPKYIGYKPINIFEQSEPYNFPYVVMPESGCIIKFPRKGRVGRKGFKEEDFKRYLIRHFSNTFKIYDDRFITVKGSKRPYEPDITFTDEKDGINIFLDIEIDEPYEGINDIAKRKATHFQYADTNRNNAFRKRGWIVVRFAEIQIHNEPLQCCHFISDVIKCIHSKFETPPTLVKVPEVKAIKQWTKEEAEQWSREKYREQYLGIDSFGFVPETEKLEDVKETDLGELIEREVDDETPMIPPKQEQKASANPKRDVVAGAIEKSNFLAFDYDGFRTLSKPIEFIDSDTFIAECFVKNRKREFSLYQVQSPVIKQKPFTVQQTGPNLGLDNIRNIVNIAIKNGKYIRMTYTKSAWSEMDVDTETGEIILNHIEAETSTRTISNVDLAVNVLAEEHIEQYNLRNEAYEYITAYCHKRDDKRTFRFDRISEIAILNL